MIPHLLSVKHPVALAATPLILGLTVALALRGVAAWWDRQACAFAELTDTP
jgi:hypothetical protein